MISILKSQKSGFPIVFLKSDVALAGSIVEIDYGFFRVFGQYYIGKSLGTFKNFIFGLCHLSLTPTIGSIHNGAPDIPVGNKDELHA